MYAMMVVTSDSTSLNGKGVMISGTDRAAALHTLLYDPPSLGVRLHYNRRWFCCPRIYERTQTRRIK